MKVVLQTPYPNRIKLDLFPMRGPLTNPSPMLGMFSPSRDLAIYNGGRLIGVDSSNYDASANAYFIFLKEPLDFNAITQVIHHMPNPPFEGEANPTLGGLSLGGHPSILATGTQIPVAMEHFYVTSESNPDPHAFAVNMATLPGSHGLVFSIKTEWNGSI